MSLENSVLTRSLLGLGVMLGAAFAAEPIFVTPPAATAPVSAPQPSNDSLDDLPVAKSYPVTTAVEGGDKRDTLSQPIFVTQPAVSAPVAIEDAAEVKRRSNADEVDLVEDKPVPPAPVLVGPPKPPQSLTVPSSATSTTQPAATAKDGVTGEAASPAAEDLKFGLGLAPIKVETGLPPELGILQTALEKVVDNTAFLPEEEGQKLLCADAGKIFDLARELSQAPLIEVTTHFTLWRSAMSDLLGSTDALRQQCQKPSQRSVGAFKKVVKDFDRLLDVR